MRLLVVPLVVALAVIAATRFATPAREPVDPPRKDHPTQPRLPRPPQPTRVNPAERCTGVDVTPSESLVDLVRSHPPGTTFCLTRGVHRVARPVKPRAFQRLIGLRGARLSGARVITGWRTNGNGRWSARGRPIPSLEAGTSFPQLDEPLVAFSEDVYLDGRPLRRVAHQDQVAGGEFFIDYAGGIVHIGEDPTGHRVEVSVAPALIRGRAPGVTIRGLVLERAAGIGIEARGSRGWRIVGNEVRRNHQIGVCAGQAAVVKSNFVHHQGQMGMCGSGKSIEVTNNEIAFNNALDFRTPEGGCWDAAGAKWVLTKGLVVRHNYVHHNRCHGLWTDIDTIDSLIAGNWVEANHGAGVFHEISYSARIRGNVVKDNVLEGILVASSQDTVVADNLVVDNGNGIVITQLGDRGNGPFGPYLARNVVVRNNRIRMLEGVSGINGNSSTGVFDRSRNRFVGNTYYLRDRTVVRFAWRGDRVPAQTWTGFDRSGRFIFFREGS